MKAAVTIPAAAERIEYKSVTSIKFLPEKKRVIVEVYGEDPVPMTYSADLTDELAGVSAANKTIILIFLKRCVAIALNTDDTDITGDGL